MTHFIDFIIKLACFNISLIKIIILCEKHYSDNEIKNNLAKDQIC